MVTGFAAMFLIHIWENIGMTIGLMPITGIPLPFLSYGGTFQLVNLICIGIALSVGVHKEGLNFSEGRSFIALSRNSDKLLVPPLFDQGLFYML